MSEFAVPKRQPKQLTCVVHIGQNASGAWFLSRVVETGVDDQKPRNWQPTLKNKGALPFVAALALLTTKDPDRTGDRQWLTSPGGMAFLKAVGNQKQSSKKDNWNNNANCPLRRFFPLVAEVRSKLAQVIRWKHEELQGTNALLVPKLEFEVRNAQKEVVTVDVFLSEYLDTWEALTATPTSTESNTLPVSSISGRSSAQPKQPHDGKNGYTPFVLPAQPAARQSQRNAVPATTAFVSPPKQRLSSFNSAKGKVALREMTVNDGNMRLLRWSENVESYRLPDATLSTKPANAQGSDYRELDLHGGLFHSLTCSIYTKSPYFRFGFKLRARNCPLFGDDSIQTPSHENLVVHIGRNDLAPTGEMRLFKKRSKNLFFTSYRNGILETPDLVIAPAQKHLLSRIVISVKPDWILNVSVDSTNVYESKISPHICGSVVMLAWGDSDSCFVGVGDRTLVVSK